MELLQLLVVAAVLSAAHTKGRGRLGLGPPFSWPSVLNFKWAGRPLFGGEGRLCEWPAVADLMLVVRGVGEGQGRRGQAGTSNLVQRVGAVIDGAVMTIASNAGSRHSVMLM